MPLLLLFRPKRHIMCRFGRLLRCFLVSYRGKLTLPLYVGASSISLALIFYTKNQSSLMPLLHVAASLLIRRIFIKNTASLYRLAAPFSPKAVLLGNSGAALRLLLLLLQKGTLGSSVRLQAHSLTAHCRYRLFASMSGCKFSIARRISFLYAKNPRLT